MNCSVSSAIPSASVDKAIAASPGFVMAHVLKGYLFGLATEQRGDGGRGVCPRGGATAWRHGAREGACRGPRQARARPLARGERGCSKTSPSTSARRAGAADRPPDRLLHRRCAHAARPHRARPAGLVGVDARLSRACSACTRSGWRRWATTAAPSGSAAAPSRSSRATAGRSTRSRMSWKCRAGSRTASPGCAPTPTRGRRESFLQVHNWWHLALFHFDLGQIDEVLKLYDGPIYGTPSTLALNMVDASAILWRLHLGGVDVGDRWAALAANWAPKAGAGNYAFNDAHAMMAFVGAGLAEPARTLIETQQRGDARRRRQCRLHPRCRPPCDAGDPGVRRWQLPRDGAAAEADPGDRPPLRRQPRPARRHRPDADRGGIAGGRRRAVARACRRAVRRAAGKPAVAAVREPGGAGEAVFAGIAALAADSAHPFN